MSRENGILGKGLHELEPHATAAKVLEGIGVVFPFGIENGRSRRYRFVGFMMVADDEVDAQRFGIGDLLDGLDAAVENDDQFDTSFMCRVYTLDTHSIALVVTVGNVVFNV